MNNFKSWLLLGWQVNFIEKFEIEAYWRIIILKILMKRELSFKKFENENVEFWMLSFKKSKLQNSKFKSFYF